MVFDESYHDVHAKGFPSNLWFPQVEDKTRIAPKTIQQSQSPRGGKERLLETGFGSGVASSKGNLWDTTGSL